jgi:hypothetical protein
VFTEVMLFSAGCELALEPIEATFATVASAATTISANHVIPITLDRAIAKSTPRTVVKSRSPEPIDPVGSDPAGCP